MMLDTGIQRCWIGKTNGIGQRIPTTLYREGQRCCAGKDSGVGRKIDVHPCLRTC